MKSIWELTQVDQSDVDSVMSRFRLHPVIARLLVARGLSDLDELDQFFNGTFRDINKATEIAGMNEAADILVEAVNKGEKILIFGDYDVDGTTATSILRQLLVAVKANVEFYIPDRLDDGYGLSEECAERLYSEHQPDVVVSVDCGITAFDAIDFFRAKGVTFVLTDHHLPVNGVPNANVVVNPKLCPGIGSEHCCGAVVSFKLALTIAQKFSGSEMLIPELRTVMTKLIPLATLATVADVMPLLGENRLIVQKGLAMMADFDSLLPGLKALIKTVGLENSSVKSTDIGFKIAPRINAAGRVANASIVVDLLCSESDAEAETIVEELEWLNSQRQEVCKRVDREVIKQIESIPNYEKCSAFVVAGRDWHKGVIGIVASRASEKYRRPVIVFTKDEDGYWCGSGRASKGTDLKGILDSCSDILVRYGGHRGAAGLSVSSDKLKEFTLRFQATVACDFETNAEAKKIKIDAVIDHQYIDISLAEELKRLEPFGEGNRRPVLLANGLSVVDVRTIGVKNQHLKVKFATELGTIIDSIGFNMGELFDQLESAKTVNLVFYPTVNEWRGRRSLDLQIDDINVVE